MVRPQSLYSRIVADCVSAGKPGAVPNRESEFERVFRDFHVRADTEVAPINRFFELSQTTDNVFEIKMEGNISRQGSQPSFSSRSIESDRSQLVLDSLADFLARLAKANFRLPKFIARLPKLEESDSISTDNISEVQKISQNYLVGDKHQRADELAKLNDRTRIVEKLLVFREDARPGYLG